MALAFRFSAAQGLCAASDPERVSAHLGGAGLPTRIADIPDWTAPADAIVDAMLQDKKVVRGSLNLILAHGIGHSFVARDVATEAVRSFLRRELNGD